MRIKIDISEFLRPRTIAISIILISMTISFALLNPILLGIYVAMCFAVFLIAIDDIYQINPKERTIFLIILLSCIIILPINLLRYPTTALHFLILLGSIAAAPYIVKDTRAYVSASLVALGFAQCSVLAFLLVNGLNDFPLEEMLTDLSSNGVTSFILCLQINYSIANFHVRKRASLITAAITFFICIIGYGRGSILASTGVLTISMLFSFPSLRRSYAILASAVLLSAASLAIVNNYQTIYDYAEGNTKLSAGLFDESRASINSEYMARMVGSNIFLGADYDGTLIERFFNGNPHNSYIRAHHIFGLPYLLLMIALAFRPLTVGLSPSEKAFHMGMLTLLLTRAWTEPIFFPTPFDLMYFSLFLMFGRARLAPART